MALRSVCNMAADRLCTTRFRLYPMKLNTPSARTFYIGTTQPRPYQDITDAQQSHSPQEIDSLMKSICAQAPQCVTPFNLFCFSPAERWSIKGLRVGSKEKSPRGRTVVLVSGMQSFERISIGVNLYVAAALSSSPIDGVEVTIFPVMEPKEYEVKWRNENINRAKELAGLPLLGGRIRLPMDDYECGVKGPLRSYVMKRSATFVAAGVELSSGNLQLTSNSLTKPLGFANMVKTNLEIHANFAIPKPAIGEAMAFAASATPPALVLELRDRHKLLDDSQIPACGDRVLATIYRLIVDTGGPQHGTRFVNV